MGQPGSQAGFRLLSKKAFLQQAASLSPSAQPAGHGRSPKMDAGANRAKEGRTQLGSGRGYPIHAQAVADLNPVPFGAGRPAG